MIFDIMKDLLSNISWRCGNRALKKPGKVPEALGEAILNSQGIAFLQFTRSAARSPPFKA
jgi:hypothetical protein